MINKNPWKTLSSKTIYENPWLRLREDQVIRPDGKEGIYSVVEIKPSIGVIVLNENNQTALVGQWRYAHNKFSWEIPTGGSSPADKDIVSSAQRELIEETGIEAKNWYSLGSIDNSNGATTDVANLYLATDLKFHETHQEPDESIITRWFDFQKALEMVMSGKITESCSVAAILKVDKLLQSKSINF
jgi:8-oxo-dGTP pyrophosphatase MutT (NUDIX family)